MTKKEDDQLTTTEEYWHEQIDAAVMRRAEASREIQGLTDEISDLCARAHAEDKILMRHLSAWVKVLDLKTNKLRPVTRQSIDTMIARAEGRPRNRKQRGQNGKIKIEAFK